MRNLYRKIRNNVAGAVVGLSALVSGTSCGTGVGLVPGSAEGDNFPGFNINKGVTMELYEEDLRSTDPADDKYKRSHIAEFGLFNCWDIELVGTIPNYTGGDLGLAAGFIPDASFYRPAPFHGESRVLEREGTLGQVKRLEIKWSDLEGLDPFGVSFDSFANGEYFTVVYNAIGVDGISRPAWIDVKYSRGHSPQWLTEHPTPGPQGAPGSPGLTPEQLYDRTIATINDGGNPLPPGQYNSAIHPGVNKARLYLPKGLELHVGQPTGVSFEELGVLQPGETDCFGVVPANHLLQTTKIGETTLDVNGDGNSINYSIYETTFNVSRTPNCTQNSDLYKVAFQLNTFHDTINDTELATP